MIPVSFIESSAACHITQPPHPSSRLLLPPPSTSHQHAIGSAQHSAPVCGRPPSPGSLRLGRRSVREKETLAVALLGRRRLRAQLAASEASRNATVVSCFRQNRSLLCVGAPLCVKKRRLVRFARRLVRETKKRRGPRGVHGFITTMMHSRRVIPVIIKRRVAELSAQPR